MSDVRLILGDCLAVLPTLESASVDSVVTDPPYGLEFMGKEWDAPWQVSSKSALFGERERETPGWQTTRNANCRSCGGRLRGAKKCECKEPDWDETPQATAVRQAIGFQEWNRQWATAALRVLKPAGYALIFGGTRTYHRLACAVEDAGFEIRDCIMWLYGSGFPKGKGCLKPAYEAILLARRPGPKVLPLQIDACRVPIDQSDPVRTAVFHRNGKRTAYGNLAADESGELSPMLRSPLGRWPANVIHDGSEEVLEAFAAFGSTDKPNGRPNCAGKLYDTEGRQVFRAGIPRAYKGGFQDTGTAARFFYCAKASRCERGEGNAHPTVKPLALMEYLVRLVTPPGGTVLDPFLGSGTTGVAAVKQGFKFIGIEREAEYMKIAEKRIAAAQAEQPLFAAAQ